MIMNMSLKFSSMSVNEMAKQNSRQHHFPLPALGGGGGGAVEQIGPQM